MVRLSQKLRRCSRALSSWGKLKFGDNRVKIKNLKTEIQAIQACPYSDDRMAKTRELQQDLEAALDRKEMYQHQRSRVDWLKYGDWNSSFFHATVIQRRQRNQLTTLKTKAGIVLEMEEEINEHLATYFQTLFQAAADQDFNDVLSSVTTVVFVEMNTNLVKPVTDVEIKAAAFHLGPLKAPRLDRFRGIFYKKILGNCGPRSVFGHQKFFPWGTCS